MLSSSVWRGGSRWWFSGGLLIGGFATALVAVALGSVLLRPALPGLVRVSVVTAAFVLVASNELGLLRIRLPQNARQVPISVADAGGQYGALQFGFEMGTGVRTFMTSGLPHALAVALILVADLPDGLMAGLAFGAGRAWMTLSRHAHRDDSAWDTAFTRYDRRIRTGLAMAFGTTLAVAIKILA